MAELTRFHLTTEWVEFDITERDGGTVTSTDAKIAIVTSVAAAAADPALGDYVTATISGSGSPTVTVSRLHGPVPPGNYVVYVDVNLAAENVVRAFPMTVT